MATTIDLLSLSDDQLCQLHKELGDERMAALIAAQERRMEAEAAQPKPARRPSREELELAKAARILRSRGHDEAAGVIEGTAAVEQNIAAVEAAMEDRQVPGGIRYRHLNPMLEAFDEADAAHLLAQFLSEVGEAARLIEEERALSFGSGVYSVRAALRRAASIRFEGRHMAAIERLLEGNRLPESATQPLVDYPQLAEAVPSARAAKPRTRARAFLDRLTKPLWAQVEAATLKADVARTRAKNPVSGFSGRKTGKTARKRSKAGG